jgi:SAM-dependent methyltransferase
VNHSDHVNLLRPAALRPGGIWADLGAGSGAFTLALRELVGPEAVIHAVDKDGARLHELERAYAGRFGPSSRLRTIVRDFSQALALPPLDGVLMANSLHYFRDKGRLLSRVRGCLKPWGLLLLVEYNVDSGNPWVPYPLSFKTFHGLVVGVGFGEPRLPATHPSSFLREFYSAVASRQEQ